MQEWGEGKLYPHFVIENTDPDAGTAEARSNTAIKNQNQQHDHLIDSFKDEGHLTAH